MKPLQIGLLDYGDRIGLNSLLKLQAVMEEAILAEQLGFSRFWLAEHHDILRAKAWTNPQPVLPVLASCTTSIKLGIAGVLMSLYQPYHVASFFKCLANIYPGRIDMGLANGYPYTQVIQTALGPEYSRDDLARLYWQNTERLLHFLADDEALYAHGEGVVIPPYKGLKPQSWLLSVAGFVGNAAEKAIQYGTALCRSLYHDPSRHQPQPHELSAFREKFYERQGHYPIVNLAVAGICHETDARAWQIARQLGLTEPALLIGGPAYFAEQFARLQSEHGVDEIIFHDMAKRVSDRQASMEILSTVFNLSGSEALHTSSGANGLNFH